jgi:ribosomal protein S18 acetylase RimI-like enzyme
MIIRAFVPEEVEVFREIRLAALQANPEAFGSSYETEQAQPVSVARERLQNLHGSPDNFVLGAWAEAGEVVGMMGLYRQTSPKEQHKGGVWGVFVRPEWRGRGIAAQLLVELLARARQLAGLEQLQLSVVTTQAAAVHLYQSRGFQTYGLEREALRDGDSYVDEYHMVLFLKEVGNGN